MNEDKKENPPSPPSHCSECCHDGPERSEMYCLHKTTFSTLTQFSLFETKSRFFLVGKKRAHDEYHVLKIDRCSTFFGNPSPQTGSASSSSSTASYSNYDSAASGTPYKAGTNPKGGDGVKSPSYYESNDDKHPLITPYGSTYAPNSSVIYDTCETKDGHGSKIHSRDSNILGPLPVTEDPNVYTLAEITKLFSGYSISATGVGVLGFVKLFAGYYLALVTKRRRVGDIDGKAIYAIEETSYVPIESETVRNESHYKNLLLRMDLTNNFYFSYEYNLSRTLQFNMKHCCKRPPGPQDSNLQHAQSSFCGNASNAGAKSGEEEEEEDDDGIEPTRYPVELDDTFVWNTHFIKPMLDAGISENWILPIVHGYYGQETISIDGHKVILSLIARRSRFCAGPRFFKRGVANDGHVANDVEVEQIIINNICGSMMPVMSSYVQVRGSIPLFWSQDKGNYMPKPAIYLDRIDPFYDSTIRHFQDLFRRYGSPITVLNMVKSEEKKPRESILLHAYTNAIQFINKALPPEYAIRYYHWDFHRAKRCCKGPEYLEKLVQLTMNSLDETKIFCTRPRVQRTCTFVANEGEGEGKKCKCKGKMVIKEVQPIMEQNGVLRCNCIDSLDRTNAAQFSSGRIALARQLFEMGIIDAPELDGASTVIKTLLRQYELMGDSLAEQYGGSGLANTMDTYTNRSFLAQGRDVMAGMRRFYRNSFTDREKQQVFNLFLGLYLPSVMHCVIPLWQLDSDYQLHNPPIPRNRAKILLSSIKWWEDPLRRHNVDWIRTNRNRNCQFDENPTNSDLDEREYKDKMFEEKHKISSICSFDLILSKSGESINWVDNTAKSPQSAEKPAGADQQSSSTMAPAATLVSRIFAVVSSVTGSTPKKPSESPTGGSDKESAGEKAKVPPRNGFDLMQTMQDLSKVDIRYEDSAGNNDHGESESNDAAPASPSDPLSKTQGTKKVRVVISETASTGTGESEKKDAAKANDKAKVSVSTKTQASGKDERKDPLANPAKMVASGGAEDITSNGLESSSRKGSENNDAKEPINSPPNSPSPPLIEEPRRRSLDISSVSRVRQKYALMAQQQQQQGQLQQQQQAQKQALQAAKQRPVVVPTAFASPGVTMMRRSSLSSVRRPQLTKLTEDENDIDMAMPKIHHFHENPLGKFGVDVNKCSDVTSYLSYLKWGQQVLDFPNFKKPSKERDTIVEYFNEWTSIRNDQTPTPSSGSFEAFNAYRKPISERDLKPPRASINLYRQTLSGTMHDPEWKDQINK